MSSVSSEKFDTNECMIARESYIPKDQNYKILACVWTKNKWLEIHKVEIKLQKKS